MVWWFRKLHIGYALMTIFVCFMCFKNNADISADAGLTVNVNTACMAKYIGIGQVSASFKMNSTRSASIVT